jgi:drug/metabolite transporter (DMT)-like permease
VAIVANPGADSLTLGAVFALLNAIMLGSVTAAVRGMSGTESTETLLMWQLATVSVLHSLLLLFGVRWAPPGDLALFALCGLANLAGQYFWTKSLTLAPTTAVSPFFYFMLVWATGIAFVVWGEIPTMHLLIGSCIVVAAGLYLLWHEANLRAAKAAA